MAEGMAERAQTEGKVWCAGRRDACCARTNCQKNTCLSVCLQKHYTVKTKTETCLQSHKNKTKRDGRQARHGVWKVRFKMDNGFSNALSRPLRSDLSCRAGEGWGG